jgi:signal transduction histidine kinase
MESKPKLLVVDDEDSFRMLMAMALRDEGFDVVEAVNGDEALARVKERSFDLALLDIRMPGVDGITVLKTLRKESPSTDCIMITGYQDITLAVEAIKLGAKEFLPKPLNGEELVQRVKSVLRAHMAEAHLRELQMDFTSKLLYNLLTPLHTLRSSLHNLEQSAAGTASQEEKNIFQSINATIKNMDALLNDMIDLSLFESGKVDITTVPTNLDELIPTICGRFKPQMSAKQITLEIKNGNEVPTVAADPMKLEQVMNNLLENAITYTPEHGTITVTIGVSHKTFGDREREYIEVAVADTGVGIPEAELPFVFDKYKEFLTGKISDQKTTGLGLAICRSIVEAHQGVMTVESEVGRGSIFRLYIPTDAV